MQNNSLHTAFDSEIADTDFEELFDTDLQDLYDTESDTIYEDSDPQNTLENLAHEIKGNIEHMDEEEAYNYVAEAWPALIPIITALAPMVIQAATKLAPMAVKAAGSFVGNLSKSKQVRKPPSRIARTVQVRPQPRPITPGPIRVSKPCDCKCTSTPQLLVQSPTSSGIGSTLGTIGQGALGTLAGLLSNKNVQGIISGLASKGISQAIKLGNSEATTRTGELLNAIEYLANQAKAETSDDQYDDALDYLIMDDGEFIPDQHDAENRALRFIELYNS